MADPGSYRPRAELYAHTEHDPVRAVIDKATFGYPSPGEIAAAGPDVVAQLVCHPSAIDHLEQKHVDEVKREVEAIVEDAVKYALQSPSPSMEDAWHSLYCNRRHETLLGVDDG